MARVCVVLGSVREGRMGERVARLVRSANIFAALSNIFAADVAAEQPGRLGHAA